MFLSDLLPFVCLQSKSLLWPPWTSLNYWPWMTVVSWNIWYSWWVDHEKEWSRNLDLLGGFQCDRHTVICLHSREHQKCSYRSSCLLVCSCVFVCVCTHVHMSLGPEIGVSVFLSCSLPYFLRRLDRLAGQQVPEVLWSLLPMAGIIGSGHHSRGLC